MAATIAGFKRAKSSAGAPGPGLGAAGGSGNRRLTARTFPDGKDEQQQEHQHKAHAEKHQGEAFA
jgi:hypothetical protein